MNGQSLTLTAFVEATDRQMARLFVPFARSRRTAPETYAGGPLSRSHAHRDRLYDLDFNRAYHPYCYFNDEYDCPFPPAENRLGIPIRAGERMKDARAGSSSRMLHAIVFDFDGVLANSEPLHFEVFRQVLEEVGITLTPEAYYSTYLGYDDVGAFQAVLRDHGRPDDEAVGRRAGARRKPIASRGWSTAATCCFRARPPRCAASRRKCRWPSPPARFRTRSS